MNAVLGLVYGLLGTVSFTAIGLALYRGPGGRHRPERVRQQHRAQVIRQAR